MVSTADAKVELIAKLAEIIHDAMVYAATECKGAPQPWQNGNSTAESYARREARDFLTALEASPISRTEATLREALVEARRTLVKTTTGCSGSDQMQLPRSMFNSVIRNLDKALAMQAARPIDQQEAWRLIAEMRWPIEQPIIVTDGLNVYGAGWWHPGEQAWLDCGGITPTLWQPLPAAPGSTPIAPVQDDDAELWAVLYLHDWDPPKDGKQPVYPEIHGVFSTWEAANAEAKSRISPEKYHVRRATNFTIANRLEKQSG